MLKSLFTISFFHSICLLATLPTEQTLSTENQEIVLNTPANHPLSLAMIEDLTLQNFVGLKKYVHLLQSAEYSQKEALANYWPEVNLDGYINQVGGAGRGRDGTGLESSINFFMPIWDSCLKHEYQEAVLNYQIQEVELQQAMMKALLRARKSYFEIHYRKRDLELNQGLVKLHHEMLQHLHQGQEKGTYTPLDLVQVQIEKSNSLTKSFESEQALFQAQEELSSMINCKARELTLSQDPPVIETIIHKVDTLDWENCVGQSPEVIRQGLIVALRLAEDCSNCANFPTITLRSNFTNGTKKDLFVDRENFWEASLNFEWDLFDFGRESNRRHRNRELYFAAVQEYEDTYRDVSLKVRNQIRAIRTAYQIYLEHKNTNALVESSLSILEEKIQRGVISLSEYLRSTKAYRDTKWHYEKAAYQLLIAYYELLSLVGEGYQYSQNVQ
jgi:outer membrane protein TolC